MRINVYFQLVCCFVGCLLFGACREGGAEKVSFYYWRSTLKNLPSEKALLADNHVTDLYLRYFDIRVNELNQPYPESPVQGQSVMGGMVKVIPVIYIQNRVFTQLPDSSLGTLASQCAGLIKQMNKRLQVSPAEIQFDCDWTPGTRQRYFDFLRAFKQRYPIALSATIRLHQYKYPRQTGVPPVSRGTLMYYNMSDINADSLNSVYDRTRALSYLTRKKPYPLPLSVALPIFHWGQQIRGGRVIALISKLPESSLSENGLFKSVGQHRYRVERSGFFRGRYFMADDEIKLEGVTDADLLTMANDLRQRVPTSLNEVIFYDLDTANTNTYDPQIFQKVAYRLH